MANQPSADTSLASQLRSFGLKSLVLRFLGMLAMFSMHLCLAKQLGAANYGVWATYLALLGLSLPVVKLGWDVALLRAGASHLSSPESSDLGALSIFAGRAILLTTAIAATIIFAHLKINDNANAEKLWWLTLFVWLFGTAAIEVFGAGLRGLKRIVLSQSVREIVRPICLTLLILAVGTRGSNGINAKSALTLGSMVAVSLGTWLFVCYRREIRRGGGSTTHGREVRPKTLWRHNCGPFWIASILLMIQESANLIILREFESDVVLGRFAISSRLASYVPLVLVTISSAASPLFVEATNRSPKIARDLFRRITLVAILGAIPIACGLLLAPEFVLGIFGRDFQGDPALLRLLVISQLTCVAVGPSQLYLAMCGFAKPMLIMLVAATATMLVFAYAGAYFGGAIGVAWANIASATFWHLGMRILAHRAFASLEKTSE